MNTHHYIQIAFWVLLMAGAAVYAGGRRINWKKSLWQPHTAFVKHKKMKEGSVQVELLPTAAPDANKNAASTGYVVRIKLKTNSPIRQKTLLQYMNFGMGKCFFAVQGGDTLVQTACEKIPCIDRNEYIYMACFHKPAKVADSSLSIYVADLLAGFENSKFEFSSKTLQQLD